MTDPFEFSEPVRQYLDGMATSGMPGAVIAEAARRSDMIDRKAEEARQTRLLEVRDRAEGQAFTMALRGETAPTHQDVLLRQLALAEIAERQEAREHQRALQQRSDAREAQNRRLVAELAVEQHRCRRLVAANERLFLKSYPER
jgi:hypothetical protein